MPVRELIPYLRLLHGSFNIVVAGLFFYQGWLGLKIRRGRLSGDPSLDAMRRHRKAGPVFAGLGILGFFAGCILVYLDKGRLLEYPLHFLNGLVLACCIGAALAISTKIRGMDSGLRTPHFVIGLGILLLYVVQILLGVAVLL